ncbi:MAG: class I SAM-dependent methyltransferase [Lachnospiraceae bacterium]|nr:class I SAM-dependent methyltransferase [Lachnospiraceae bacterium]
MFWDRVSGIYDIYQMMNRKANDKAAFICASYISKKDTVLECACGTGIMTEFIAPACKRIVATDVSKPMLKRARKKLKEQDNILFRQADITDIKYKDDTFDVAVAANVIHLLDHPEKAISELKRVVKKDGLIIIPTYISQQADSSAKLTKIFNKMGANFKKEFDQKTYREFFDKMGLNPKFKTAKGLISCCVAVIRNDKD